MSQQSLASLYRLGEAITANAARLATVTEQQSLTSFRSGGWSRKQILGHLIDSALNNHGRFVRAALDGSYEGPGYAQDAWVAIHDYQALPWYRLLLHWKGQNELLANVVRNIPESRLVARCQIGTNEPVTLGFLIDDYLVHMKGHVNQILTGL